MQVHLQVVEEPQQLKTYIYLPAELHAGYAAFVPPFYKDEFDFHDPEKNKQLQNSTTITLLAYCNDKPAGRVMGIIYHPWNKKMNVNQARFYQLDCIDDTAVAFALLNKVESWARENGMNEIIGSFGFSDKDPQGIQIEGFECAPVIASVSHQPYLSGLVEAAGYSKFKDCVSYLMQIPEIMPEIYTKAYRRILKNQRLKLLEFKSRKALRPYFNPIMRLMNAAYRHIFGFVPMDESDINHLADQYLSVLDPALVKIVTDDNEQPVAFVIAMANISTGIKKAKGKLFPFGFIFILNEMKKSRQLDLLLGAVSENYRGRGLNVLLGISLMETARQKGMKLMDSHLILEENRMMRAELEKLGGRLHKRYRIYSKKLS